MALYAAVFDIPNQGDKHYTRRNLDEYVHTNEVMRGYRDHFIQIYGVERAYNMLIHPLGRTVRRTMYGEYVEPYYNLQFHIADLSHEALMVGSTIALAEVLGDDSHVRRNERELVHEIAGADGQAFALPVFPAEFDAVDRSRRLYAIYAAILAERWIPAVPAVADILAREFGGEVLLPRFRSAQCNLEERLAIRTILSKYGAEESDQAFKELEDVLPPAPEVWDMEPVMEEIAETVIRTFFEAVEGEDLLTRIVAEIRPKLDAYNDPREQFYKEHCEWIPGFDEAMLERILGARDSELRPYVREWVDESFQCGYPIDLAALPESYAIPSCPG